MVVEPTEIATRLRDGRRQAHKTQGEIAAASKMPQTTLSQWEQGDIPAAVTQFARVASALGLSSDKILLADMQENELATERQTLPATLADDMMALTRVLIAMHHKAEAQGPGVSPITLFREHAEGLNKHLLGRRDGPAAESQQYSTPLDPQLRAVADLLKNIVRENGAESGSGGRAADALISLLQKASPRTRPVSAPVPPATDSHAATGKESPASSPPKSQNSNPAPSGPKRRMKR